ncbi:hypothetical protein EIN_226200 [Entamoeba invadens IP1]|uniref:Uncharacterized protein n=1 Tax=Entamoeba invadens IP1 TaxID=370355 RepID=A0A0A1U2G7_ENTIV|nr:hypothetical protein EIN_226200 [Entamoeba invadens IP1]ELP88257.1 hypothetical protein EIN_226200 [Entamoeba invadens IP1]|eukprot:XP_004255028.1 hypothetical protein EIN_226200 [Entamoeba invadens IP1]
MEYDSTNHPLHQNTSKLYKVFNENPVIKTDLLMLKDNYINDVKLLRMANRNEKTFCFNDSNIKTILLEEEICQTTQSNLKKDLILQHIDCFDIFGNDEECVDTPQDLESYSEQHTKCDTLSPQMRQLFEKFFKLPKDKKVDQEIKQATKPTLRVTKPKCISRTIKSKSKKNTFDIYKKAKSVY